ncbi:MAG: VTT domain-containing protein [bacterium]
MRKPFRFLIIYVLYVISVFVFGFFIIKGQIGELLYYLAYMSLGSTFIPIPTNPVVLVMGRFYQPLIVALIGASGTASANLLDYALISTIARSRVAERVKGTYLYKFWMRLYKKVPFLALTLTNFLPIPVDFIRFISIFEHYERHWFFLASFAGRLPRYLLLAWLGFVLPVSLPILIAIGCLFFLPALVPVVRRIFIRKERKREYEGK